MERISGSGEDFVFNYVSPALSGSCALFPPLSLFLSMLAEAAAAILDHAGDLANGNRPRVAKGK